ncbi:hypothetical protein L2E82_11012 [Cichorium intybus]|uniref:Uncharacterized protein n=1 Tax=Cichorium intybus TaxID=13427 RepID=A0ACB9GC05_CICIN|nr:hypothetical protein L2E82_11012 [Cichorium intybus]
MAVGRICILTRSIQNLNCNNLCVRWKDVSFNICIKDDGDWSPPFLNGCNNFVEDEERDSETGISDTCDRKIDDEFSVNSDDDSDCKDVLSSNDEVRVPESVLNRYDAGGNTPLHEVDVSNEKVDKLNRFVVNGSNDSQDLNRYDAGGNTPLHDVEKHKRFIVNGSNDSQDLNTETSQADKDNGDAVGPIDKDKVLGPSVIGPSKSGAYELECDGVMNAPTKIPDLNHSLTQSQSDSRPRLNCNTPKLPRKAASVKFKDIIRGSNHNSRKSKKTKDNSYEDMLSAMPSQTSINSSDSASVEIAKILEVGRSLGYHFNESESVFQEIIKGAGVINGKK